MGAAHEQRGIVNLTRPFQQAVDDANFVDECFRLLVAADEAAEYCRDVNTKLAAILAGKGIAAGQQQAYLNCRVGRSRLDKYLDARTRWIDARTQRQVAFSALEMRKAAEYLMAWIP